MSNEDWTSGHRVTSLELFSAVPTRKEAQTENLDRRANEGPAMLRGISNDEFARLLRAIPLPKEWNGRLGEFHFSQTARLSKAVD
jgi:hypothetical protein